MFRARAPEQLLRGIAVSVNAEYAQARRFFTMATKWGCCRRSPAALARCCAGRIFRTRASGEQTSSSALTREPIDAEKIVAAAKRGEDGAVVVFDGIVRNHSRGRRTLHLDYEAYEEMAVKQMRELGRQARERFGVRQVTMVHRLGRLEIGETSVLIVVASRTAARPSRPAAG